MQSVAAGIYKNWNLDRQIIKDCHIAMSDSRGLQVTMNSIVGATRFKTLAKGKLMRAKCPRPGCGAQDSWGRFQDCYKIPPAGGLVGDTEIQAIREICKTVLMNNPVKPLLSGAPNHRDANPQV